MAKKRQDSDKNLPAPSPHAPDPDATAAGKPALDFPVVGMGASAGGLKALQVFFTQMPAERAGEIAFVLVQHLPPDYKSSLAQLLHQYTSLPVLEIEEGMEVAPGNIYIAPPGSNLSLAGGSLHLHTVQSSPDKGVGLNLPIDHFFRSLAVAQKERAICIILSGTGTDGTLGLKAIKGEGGMAMAQHPPSAEHAGMPGSALATGLVDFVLPPAELPAQLLTYLRHPYHSLAPSADPPAILKPNVLQQILALLRARTGHNFAGYKPNTLGRRIERRLAVNQIERPHDYVRYLEQTPLEAEALFREMLIGYTTFFRDAEAFKVLKEQVIPAILKAKTPGESIRVWVPACSSGEEAYSIAMLLQEKLDEANAFYKVQIFATDIDHHAIEQARTGIYPVSIAADLSPERLQRFFTRVDGGSAYRIKKTLRELLVFAEQNVVDNPPFSHLDLISCRNLLIYLDRELQKRVLYLFHYALNRHGFLFLGSSESLGEFLKYFTPVDRKHKIYQSKSISPARLLGKDFSLERSNFAPLPQTGVTNTAPNSMSKLIETMLLCKFAPACAVISEGGEILYIHGRTGKYLEPAQGEARMNILQMARPGLRLELTAALRQAAALKEAVHYQGLQVQGNGGAITVNLSVSPIAVEDLSSPKLFLAVFEEINPAQLTDASQEAAATLQPDISENTRFRQLEQELLSKDERLQTIIEELETSNEELQSANEEYQSTNEELETSREELQSVNEELTTVNMELQQKLEELSRANNDMHNMLAGTGVGTIFVDLQQRIKKFTPAATRVINLLEADLGRPLGHFAANIAGYERLVEDVQSVLDTLRPHEEQLKTRDGMDYLMRIIPYRTLDNVIEGAVLTFTEITAQIRLQEAVRRLAVVIQDSNDAITVLDLEGRYLAWNPGAEKLFGWSEGEALALNVRDMLPQKEQKRFWTRIRKLAAGNKLKPFQIQRLTRDGTSIEVWVTATALLNESGEPYAVATTEIALHKR